MLDFFYEPESVVEQHVYIFGETKLDGIKAALWVVLIPNFAVFLIALNLIYFQLNLRREGVSTYEFELAKRIAIKARNEH